MLVCPTSSHRLMHRPGCEEPLINWSRLNMLVHVSGNGLEQWKDFFLNAIIWFVVSYLMHICTYDCVWHKDYKRALLALSETVNRINVAFIETYWILFYEFKFRRTSLILCPAFIGFSYTFFYEIDSSKINNLFKWWFSDRLIQKLHFEILIES